jgi:hypothetical protein
VDVGKPFRGADADAFTEGGDISNCFLWGRIFMAEAPDLKG